MHLQYTRILVFGLLTLLLACDWSGEGEEEEVQVQEILKECHLDIDTIDFSFGIDYDDPDQYLIPGEQSDLQDSFFVEVMEALDPLPAGRQGLLLVCRWVNENFSFQNAGGGMVGIPTVNDLFESRTFYGCHSAALLISSILRSYGHPVVMIETAGVQWAHAYHAGNTQSFLGHVMSEVFIDSSWILLDNNCSFVADYDPLNPFIPTQDWNPNDYFVYAKGLDTWDYACGDAEFTHNMMVDFAENVYCFEDMFNTVDYVWW